MGVCLYGYKEKQEKMKTKLNDKDVFKNQLIKHALHYRETFIIMQDIHRVMEGKSPKTDPFRFHLIIIILCDSSDPSFLFLFSW